MLDDDEFDRVVGPTLRTIKFQREIASAEYTRITGDQEMDASAVLHHRISIYMVRLAATVASP